MNIAVFADLHGRIALCFLLCARWERETGERLDAIFQAGDLGAYPERGRLDRATIKHARRDVSELGFSTDFAMYREEVARILAQTTCPMIFVRGNHEDQEWLDGLERATDGPLFTVDAYQRIHCLKTGMPYTLPASDGSSHTLTVLGIGRIGAQVGAARAKPKYIQEYEQERLYDLGALTLDVLLTHDAARSSVYPDSGLEEAGMVLDAYKPRYHFYGHTEEPYRERLYTNGVTTTARLADLNWLDERTRGRLSPDVMGILRWHDRDNASFAPVRTPWLDDYNQWNWQAQMFGN